MADEISDVVNDLNALNTATLRSAVEFSGFTKSITQAAAGADGASKAWTTFSRLVSGSPIWAVQNKLRAYLSILAAFENTSKANVKAMKEEDKKFVQKIHSMKRVNKQHQEMNEYVKENIRFQVKHKVSFEESSDRIKTYRKDIEKLTKTLEKEQAAERKAIQQKKEMADKIEADIKSRNIVDDLAKRSMRLAMKLNKEVETYTEKLDNQIALKVKEAESFNASRESAQQYTEQIEEAVKNTKEYALAIAAGATEQMAFAEGTVQLNARFKELQKDEKKLTRAAKSAYAFDTKRASTRKKLAREKAKTAGKGRLGQMLAGRTGARREKAQMAKEQKIIKSKEISENAQMLPSIKDLEPLMKLGAPLFAILKIAGDRKKLQLKMIKFTNKLKGGLDIAFRYFLFGVLAIIAFMTLIPVFFAIKNAIKPFMGDIKHFGGRLLDFGKDIFDVIKTFMDGDFDKAIKMIGPLVDTGIGLLIDFGMGLFTIGKEILFALIDMGIEFVHKFFTDPEFREPIVKRLFQVAKIILAAWFVKTILANAIQLAGIYLIPAMIAIVIAAVIYRAWMLLVDEYASLVTHYVEGVSNYLERIWDYIQEVWKGSKKFIKFVKDGIMNVLDALDWDLLHTGGVASGGTTMVGERGPELVQLPKGARVYNNQQTPSMSKGGGNTVNNYITINAKDTSDQELRRIADKIGSMVNNKINRTTSSRTFG